MAAQVVLADLSGRCRVVRGQAAAVVVGALVLRMASPSVVVVGVGPIPEVDSLAEALCPVAELCLAEAVAWMVDLVG